MTTYKCTDEESYNWFITLLFFGSCFAIVTLTSIFLTYRFRKNNPEFPLRDLISRFALSVSLLIKTILLFVQAFGYHNLKMSPNAASLAVSFGGYIVNIAYLSVLYSWCDIFLSVVGGMISKTFKIAKISMVVIMVCSVTQYIITIIADADTVRVVFSIFWDFCVIVLFIGMLVILIFKLEVRWSCTTFGPEQIVLMLCSLCSVALVIRLICFIVYASWYMGKGEEASLRSDCEVKQMVNYIIKESLGQLAPFLSVIFSDFLSHFDERSDYQAVAETEAFQALA